MRAVVLLALVAILATVLAQTAKASKRAEVKNAYCPWCKYPLAKSWNKRLGIYNDYIADLTVADVKDTQQVKRLKRVLREVSRRAVVCATQRHEKMRLQSDQPPDPTGGEDGPP
jgi:hypothetical protein